MIGIASAGMSQAIASLEYRIGQLGTGMSDRLDKASDAVYEATRAWYDSEGDGTWPPLAESTVIRKESQGYGEPARALYAEGNLYESATSPNGPYSIRMHVRNEGAESVVMIVDWENGGWQIPVVLAEGTDSAGVGRQTTIPARPIWAPPESVRDHVGEILMRVS